MALNRRGAELRHMCHFPRTLLSRVRLRVVTKWREDSGAELVEAAVVLPILLMLLLGIITFGRAWNVYQTITRAAREGAREAVLTPCALCSGPNYSASDIWNEFIDPALQASSVDPTQVMNPSIIYVNLNPAPGDTSLDPCKSGYTCVCGVQISFKYPFIFSLPFTSINMSQINLPVTVQMRLENQSSTCPVGNDYTGPNP